MSVDHDARRSSIANAMRRAVIARGATCSLHDLARAAEVSIPTVKHYFGDRSGAIAAALRERSTAGRFHVEGIATPSEAPLLESLVSLALRLADAWRRHGVGRAFTSGMSAGMDDPVIGPGYVDGVLEPVVRALEERLAVHAARGEMSIDASVDLELRTAALAFLSPLIVALMHQVDLSGAQCRPLDLPAFIATHAQRFTRAYGRA